MPLTGRPSTAPIVQFHDQCRPRGSQRLLVRRYAIASQTPASAVLTKVKPATTFGFSRCALAKKPAVRMIETHARRALTIVCSGYPRNKASSAAPNRRNAPIDVTRVLEISLAGDRLKLKC